MEDIGLGAARPVQLAHDPRDLLPADVQPVDPVWGGEDQTRHGVGGNIASYVRIVEEECFVELYCDMEQLEAEHEPRRWPDDRYSSNTWGPLPPRSYFRFDAAAVASERESLEMLGRPLPEEVNA